MGEQEEQSVGIPRDMLLALGRFSESDPLELLLAVARQASSEGHILRLESDGILLLATAESDKIAKLRALVRELDDSTMSEQDAYVLVLTARALLSGWRPKAGPAASQEG